MGGTWVEIDWTCLDCGDEFGESVPEGKEPEFICVTCGSRNGVWEHSLTQQTEVD